MTVLRFKLSGISSTQVAIILALTFLALFMLLPIIYIFNHSFKPAQELFLFPPTFFVKNPTWHNFDLLFLHSAGSVVPFTRYLFNSLVVVVISLVAVVLVSALAGYALSKHRFHFKGLIMALIMVGLMFAAETVSIPRFLIISWLQINNTYFGHVLPFLASPVAVFLIKQFIDQLPDSLIEAAKLDGATEFDIFLRVVFPLVIPAVATIAILTFQMVWADTESSTLYMQKETMKTLAYYVTTLTNGLQNNVAGQGIAAAASFLMFLPNLIIFLLFQRRVIETMIHSGVKE